MSVSKLSKVELNRAMIWLYPKDIYGCYTRDRERTVYWSKVFGTYGVVDYLLNYNLTMPLAVENHLDMVDFDGKMWRIYGTGAYYSKHKILIRPICEALVLIALEKKNG